jgi:hypothetical protein
METHFWRIERCRRSLARYTCTRTNRKMDQNFCNCQRNNGQRSPYQQQNQTKEDQAERRKPRTVLQVANRDQAEVIVCKKFSSWRRLLRVTAYVRRFVQNLQALRKMSRMNGNPDVRIQLELGPLSTNELEKSEAYWIKEAQTSLHDRVKSGQLRQLSPFTDEDGIVRVGGRVDQALVSYDTKHPVLLPRNHWISHLITQHSHGIGHTGVATTVAKIRKKYWILRGHDLAKFIRVKCVICKRFDAKVEEQYMANLPSIQRRIQWFC